MTTFIKMEKKCAICGEFSVQNVMTSTSAYGFYDLDFRPPNPLRYSFGVQIEICPHCNYSVPRIDAWYAGADEVVSSAEYKEQFKSTEYPPLANAFLCSAMVFKKAEMFNWAGESSIRAAWFCDDFGTIEQAKQCRSKAGELFKRAIEMNQRFMEKPYSEQLKLTDIFRRAGRFLDASRECKKGLEFNPEKLIKNALLFEKQLIKKEDTERHHFGEVRDDVVAEIFI